MKLFHCDNCQQTIYFESTRCVSCGEAVGYSPEAEAMFALRKSVPGADDVFEVSLDGRSSRVRQCRNTREHDACNWLVPSDGGAEYCASCALSEVIPDLS